MEIVDIFRQDMFSTTSLTAVVNKSPFTPRFLESLGIFTPNPIRSIDAGVMINDNGTLTVVPTTPRGSPPIEQIQRPEEVRTFRTPRIALGDTIHAHELQGMLARAITQSIGGGRDAMTLLNQDLQSEIAFRVDGPNQLREKVENTKERMRLGAISGIVLDADGSTLYNWPTLFNVALPAEIDFDLDNATPVSGALLKLITQTSRAVLRAARAGNLPNVRVIALCGDAFYDDLIAHSEVRDTYKNWQAAVDLRVNRAFQSFTYGSVEWINYRGSDDNSTIAIDTNKCKFIPVGVPGLFQEVLAPAESFEFVNTPGLPIYILQMPDRDRNQFVRLEVYSYPMYIATRPDVLFSGRRT